VALTDPAHQFLGGNLLALELAARALEVNALKVIQIIFNRLALLFPLKTVPDVVEVIARVGDVKDPGDLSLARELELASWLFRHRFPFALARFQASITSSLTSSALVGIGVRNRRNSSTASKNSWSTRICHVSMNRFGLTFGMGRPQFF